MRNVCVYCGSSPGRSEHYLEAARALGSALARRGLGVVYGGGRVGLMGAVADSALDSGGEVHGVIPYGLVQLEVGHTGLTRLDVVDTLHERKARMDELSDAFIALPGGHGTFEELFEAVTWLQLGIHAKPVVVVNLGGYYDALFTQLDRCVEEGFLRPEFRHLAHQVATVEEALETLDAWRPPPTMSWARRGSQH